jgi:hypothetical protein
MASTSLKRTIGTATSTTKGTFSYWVKRATLTDDRMITSWGSVNSQFLITWQDQAIMFGDFDGSYNLQYKTNRLFRDTSAWYHIVVAIDTTLATSTDRVKLYVNGVQETSFSTSTAPSQNLVLNFSNNGEEFRIGERDSGEYLNGSMTHIHFTDGTAYNASTFGEFDAQNVWKPKTQPSVTYGNNGFFLKFANAGSLGTDSSGNGNDFTVNGTGTQTLDTPSNVFATLNPLIPIGANFSNGNLTHSTTSGGYKTALTTLGVSSSKWYSEFKITTDTSYLGMGVGNLDKGNINAITYLGDSTNGVILHPGANGLYYNATNPSFTTGTTFANGDIIGIALDIDNGFIYWHKNGTYMNSGVPTSGATGTGGFAVSNIANSDGTGTYAFGVTTSATAGTRTITCNFGNGYFSTTAVSTPNADGDGYGKFEYSVPTGYYALCTKNIQTYG